MSDTAKPAATVPAPAPTAGAAPDAGSVPPPKPKIAELGGPAGPEPTRYGDWERNGRCIDF